MELLDISFTKWVVHLELFLWLNNPEVGFNKYFVKHPLEQFETLWNQTHGVAGHLNCVLHLLWLNSPQVRWFGDDHCSLLKTIITFESPENI